MAVAQACNPSTVRDRDRRIAEGVLAINLTRFSERPSREYWKRVMEQNT